MVEILPLDEPRLSSPAPLMHYTRSMAAAASRWESVGDYAIWTGNQSLEEPPHVLMELREGNVLAAPSEHADPILHRIPARTPYRASGLFGFWHASDADTVWVQAQYDGRRFYSMMMGGYRGRPEHQPVRVVLPPLRPTAAASDVPYGDGKLHGVSAHHSRVGSRVQRRLDPADVHRVWVHAPHRVRVRSAGRHDVRGVCEDVVVAEAERVDVGSVRDLDEKSVLRVALSDGRVVAVAQLADGEYRAFESRCPHKGGPIADGRIREETDDLPVARIPVRPAQRGGRGTPSIMTLPLLPVAVESDRILVDTHSLRPLPQSTSTFGGMNAGRPDSDDRR